MTKPLTSLTQRESEVLTLLASGHLYKEIGGLLNISIDTVKKHCKNIYRKLNVRNRTEAVNSFNALKNQPLTPLLSPV